jgi:hypothetical protein
MNDALVCFILDRVFIMGVALFILSASALMITGIINILEEYKVRNLMIASLICTIIFGIITICTPTGDDYMKFKEVKKPVVEQPKPQAPKPSNTKPAGSIEEI